jgi:hypothetical protein
MSTITSAGELVSTDAVRPLARLGTALELLLVYAGLLFYIWQWQFTRPRMWMLLFAAVLFSHVFHRDTLQSLGLTVANLRVNATLVLPLALSLYLPVLVFGLARRGLVRALPGRQAFLWFFGYGSWCVFQQYLMQSYFHNRMMEIIRNRHVTSLMIAIMFGGAHIPNPILMIVTTLGGFALAEVFARHRNIWPLALAQTVGGLLVAAIAPASLIHNMRVGPGYFFFRIRG